MPQSISPLRELSEDYEENNAFFEKRTKDKYKLLSNDVFLTRYPGIVKVAEILDETSNIHYRITGNFNLFDRLDIKNVNDYLLLLSQRH